MTTMNDSQARTWGMLCHLLALTGLLGIPFANIIGPLIMWQLKKNESPLVNEQGKESLNFQISVTIYMIVAALLMFVLIGFILLPAILITSIVFVIIASVKTSNGETYRYPLCIRFIK